MAAELDNGYHPGLYAFSEDNTGIYIGEIAKIPLLSASDEVKLAKIKDQGLQAKRKLCLEGISPEDREQLNKEVEMGLEATGQLVQANTRLVVAIAKRYQERGLDLDDLIQEGNLGLYRGAVKFDWTKGFRFTTYVSWWIRQGVTRAIADTGRTIRLPSHIATKLSVLGRESGKIASDLGRPPTSRELATKMELPHERVLFLQQIALQPLSLETPIGEEKDGILVESIEDQSGEQNLETLGEIADARAKIDAQLDQALTPREAQIIRLRFGLYDGRQHELKEIGDELGISGERVRQIEEVALNKLRRPHRRAALIELMGD